MNELAQLHSPSDAPPEYQDDQDEGMEPPPAEKCQLAWESAGNGLDAFRDAREIVRLIQCAICSQPLIYPVALPCGNSLCRSCLPQSHTRGNISYPNTPDRREAFNCPFPECTKEHAVADCAVDFTLAKIMAACDRELRPTKGDEIWSSITSLASGGGTARQGRLAATWAAVNAGNLPYHADRVYSGDEDPEVDRKLFRRVKDRACPELECQVCYTLLFDPVTTHCGHTFCRVCLQRVLDHAQPCPSCRQNLQLPSVLPPQLSNKRLTEILVGLCPDELAQRAATASLEEQPGTVENELITPIFVCAASFPGMPTVLYIFEPKYRLMIRRAMEGNRLFGMVLSNSSGIAQGELGLVPFMQHGTMLRIEHIETKNDGTSYIWTMGVSKFSIRRWGMRDGYVVANTERFDDIPIAEEEAMELAETHNDIAAPSRRIHHLSTEELRRICETAIRQFVSAETVDYHKIVTLFGEPPAEAASIPYWICTVFPIDSMLKYQIISSTSVRSRLKICVAWIQSVQNQRRFSTPNCTVF